MDSGRYDSQRSATRFGFVLRSCLEKTCAVTTYLLCFAMLFYVVTTIFNAIFRISVPLNNRSYSSLVNAEIIIWNQLNTSRVEWVLRDW